MNFFDKFKLQSAAERLQEEQLYEIVLDELDQGVKRTGLWAKALAKSAGDENRAKSLYIEFRVQSLKDEKEISNQLAESRRREAEARRREAEAARMREERLANKLAEKKTGADGQRREKKFFLKAQEILVNLGYRIEPADNYWLVIEPTGSRKKLASVLDLYEYAIASKRDRQ